MTTMIFDKILNFSEPLKRARHRYDMGMELSLVASQAKNDKERFTLWQNELVGSTGEQLDIQCFPQIEMFDYDKKGDKFAHSIDCRIGKLHYEIKTRLFGVRGKTRDSHYRHFFVNKEQHERKDPKPDRILCNITTSWNNNRVEDGFVLGYFDCDTLESYSTIRLKEVTYIGFDPLCWRVELYDIKPLPIKPVRGKRINTPYPFLPVVDYARSV